MAENKPTIKELEAQIEALVDQVSDLRKTSDQNYSSGREWKQRADEAEREVRDLKDELHAMTIEKARLEGYIDRTRQFDPKPEPVMVPLGSDRIEHSFDHDMLGYGSTGDRKAPWYRR
jgi:hypothetical protein